MYELNTEAFEFFLKCYQQEGCFTEDKEFIEYCLSEGILFDSPQKPLPHTIRQSPTPSLRYLELLITDRCNLRCRHCYIGETEQQELPLEKIKKVLQEFEAIQGLRLLISGGEPLLHSEFEGLNDFLKDYPLRKILLTNGLLLTEKRLSNLNVEEIQISIDGLQKGHEALRGRGTFQKTVDALKRTIQHGYDVSVSTMVHPENLDEFDEMDALFRELGVKEWTVDVPCSYGRLKENPELSLSPKQAGRYLRYGYGGGFHGGREGFGCGIHLVSVLADGTVAKCAFYAETPVGSIDDGLQECWERIQPVKLSDLSCDCRYLEICRGGCRYRAELLGDPKGKDLYKCFAFED